MMAFRKLPPALPVPNCNCGKPAEVKQSRWRTTVGRAFYMCPVKRTAIIVGSHFNSPYYAVTCDFFQWIDGPNKFDPRIRLFAYHQDETKPFNEFKRWVPPPPSFPLQSEEE
ncbi:hypothetical protein HU200_033506 [Digitaria exilis]|uniref:GRF-type domain-containing protein n=1 Tax=Digitaria exilis TaxID=1010633 RepID=A0A835BI39_9POAL|nr:hypothetical protein HU200_033506 [Digitaria exilis]